VAAKPQDLSHRGKDRPIHLLRVSVFVPETRPESHVSLPVIARDVETSIWKAEIASACESKNHGIRKAGNQEKEPPAPDRLSFLFS